MKFVVITGLSGAGKSQAMNILEDMGYYCVDNMPTVLFPKFVDICAGTDSNIDKVALVVDTRGGELFTETSKSVEDIKSKGNKCELLFLEATDEALVKRYKESRRKHPLSPNGRALVGIEKERVLLSSLKEKADYIIDTSDTTTKELKEKIAELFDDNYDENSSMSIHVLSFGFKHGIPLDSDLVFDVRFLPNPFYIPELKPKTGVEKEVEDYVKKWPQTKEFIKHLKNMLLFLVPHYIEEGKAQLVISVGCTGGRHRSVTIVNEVYKILTDSGYNVSLSHRDIGRDR